MLRYGPRFPVAVLLRSAIWKANSKTLPRSMSSRKLSMQAHDHYHLADPPEGAGAILACTMKEMKLLSVLLDRLDRVLILDTGGGPPDKKKREIFEETQTTKGGGGGGHPKMGGGGGKKKQATNEVSVPLSRAILAQRDFDSTTFRKILLVPRSLRCHFKGSGRVIVRAVFV